MCLYLVLIVLILNLGVSGFLVLAAKYVVGTWLFIIACCAAGFACVMVATCLAWACGLGDQPPPPLLPATSARRIQPPRRVKNKN